MKPKIQIDSQLWDKLGIPLYGFGKDEVRTEIGDMVADRIWHPLRLILRVKFRESVLRTIKNDQF